MTQEVREAERWTAKELAELTLEISRHDSEPYIRFTYVHGDTRLPIPGITEAGAKAVQAVLANFAETYARSTILRLAEEADNSRKLMLEASDPIEAYAYGKFAAWLREKAA